MAIKIAGQVEKSFYNSAKLTKKELQSIAREAAASSNNVKKSFGKQLSEAGPFFNGLEKAGKTAFKAVEMAAAAAAVVIGGVVAGSVMVGAAFEEQMSTVKAISGASASEFDQLNEKAKEIGIATKFSATQAGEAMEYMAMAGWKTKDMLGGIDGVINLAAASGEDLGEVSDIVTDSMTAFGLGADQVNHFADVLAAAATNSNTNVGMMGATFQYAAPLAGALGYSIEDTAIAIGLMANSGIKADKAGTALRKFFSETTAGAKVSAAAFGEHTIETANADGSMRELRDIMQDLRGAFSQMTESERAANAEAISGKTGMSGLLAVVNATEVDYAKLTESIDSCNGAAKEMADIRMDNLRGDVTILGSTLEGTGIQIYEELSEPLRMGVQWVTGLVEAFSKNLKTNNFVKDIMVHVPTAIRGIKELGSAAGAFMEPFFAVGNWLVQHPGVIVGAIAGLGTAIATYRIASGITSIVSAMSALGPVGWAILGIAGVVAVIAGIGTSVKKAAAEAKKANLEKHFGNMALSMDDLESAAEHLVSSKNLEKVRESVKAFEELEGLDTIISDSVSAIGKMNWKMSIGMELSGDEQNSYKDEMTNFANRVQEYATQKQYAISMSIGVLTEDDLQGQNMVDQVNQFYTGKQNELANIGTQLNDTITDAFQDGLLDFPEAQKITELQQKMARIQEEMTGKTFESNMELLNMRYTGKDLNAESFENLIVEVQTRIEAATEEYGEAYANAISAEKTMLQDGAISQREYEANKQVLDESYHKQVGDMQYKASEFITRTISQQYAPEIGGIQEGMGKNAETALGAAAAETEFNGGTQPWGYDQLSGYFGVDEVEESTRDAIAEMWNLYEPLHDELKQTEQWYRQNGSEKKAPWYIERGVEKGSEIGIIAGNEGALWDRMGNAAKNNEKYSETLQEVQKSGKQLPESIAAAIEEGQPDIDAQVRISWESTKTAFETNFTKGFKVDVPVQAKVRVERVFNENGNLKAPYSPEYLERAGVGGHSDGGIFEKPHLTWFSEKGPEAAIPLDGSARAIGLWEEAGQRLGINKKESNVSSALNSMEKSGSADNSGTGDGGMQITFSPNLNFNGPAPSKEDVREAVRLSQDEFEGMFKKYMKNNGRFSFA